MNFLSFSVFVRWINRLALSCLTALLLTACGGGGDSSTSNTNPVDSTVPTISLQGSSSVNHEQGTAYSDAGATASDNVDGTVAVTSSGSVGSAAGTYTLTYTATDSAGNSATATRTVTVADTTAPVMTLGGSATPTITQGTAYTDQGATATDTVDGTVQVVTSGSVGAEVGAYTLTYTATDSAGNSATVTRVVTVEESGGGTGIADPFGVFDNGAVDAAWDLGLSAFDQAISWGTCDNDGGAGCPSIGWALVNDTENGSVLEITHASTGQTAAVFTKTSTPHDMSDYAGGSIELDVKIISGDNHLSMKIDCEYPCTSGNFDLGTIDGSGWVSVTVQINDLVAQDLDLTTVDTGLVIWASNYTDTVFRVDNIRWVANPHGPSTNPGGGGGSNSGWVNPNFTGYETPLSYAGYTLLWADEFNAGELNTGDWGHDIGTGNNGWGNNELQYYRSQNASVKEGLLVIEAKEESYGGRNYTSSRIKTQGRLSFKYGRIDIRAAMPQGKGLWPALWMLGENFSTVGWPYCGEIDIMEMVGGSGGENTVHGTAHWNNGGIGASYSVASHGNSYALPSGETLANAYHVYSLVWTENSLTWYLDDVQYHSMAVDSGVNMSVFQKEFFLIFNLAIGGNWPGSPNTNTQFPEYMLVDYVRVFQAN